MIYCTKEFPNNYYTLMNANKMNHFIARFYNIIDMHDKLLIKWLNRRKY